MATFFKCAGLFLTTLFLCPIALVSQEWQKDKHVAAALIAETAQLSPGKSIRVGVLLQHDPHWHTYWKSTATGYATSLEWDLPEGITASEIQWPAPSLYEFQGYVEYVYEDQVLLPVRLDVDSDFRSDGPVELKVNADWLMCEKTCIPGNVDLSLSLPLVEETPTSHPEFFTYFKEIESRLPEPIATSPWSVDAWRQGDTVILEISGNQTVPEELVFFDAQAFIKPTVKQSIQRLEDTKVRMSFNVDPAGIKKADNLVGVLKSESDWPADSNKMAYAIEPPIKKSPPQSKSIGGIALLAFLGGLILNLMPCVFPVLGIKVMGFVNQAGESRRHIALHGLIFTVGVLVSFWALAVALIIFRSAGQELGWGFQLQSPVFVYALALFLFIFALNMSGLFEVGQSAVGVGSQLTAKSGLSGSFFSGILATVVATPCAAPFLAPALGAALALPPASSLFVFTAIGLGLSVPYLLLSLFPRMVDLLPRPGPWMETFKQAMSFLLYATVGYLLWVLVGQLTETNGYAPTDLLLVIFSLVGTAVAGWAYGRWGAYHRKTRIRYSAYVATALILLGSVFLGYPKPPSDEEKAAAQVQWDTWAPNKAEALANEGKIVYVDFTARWCVTCQTNKATVFSSDKVRGFIREKDVVLLKADWTNRDPDITAALARYNRSAVPFNLVYGPGQSQPIPLPEILTPKTVLQALQNAK